MRSTTGPIWDAWNAGGFLVSDSTQPMCRVTVEVGWELGTLAIAAYDKTPFGVPVGAGLFGTAAGAGYNKGPVRWFQRGDTAGQVETEIPQDLLIELDITQSIDQDAATCIVTMLNQLQPTVGVAPQFPGEYGEMGYYSYSRGAVANRWGHTPNAWANVLLENALIRTYQGYGAVGMTIQEALASGNLVQTGCWLVDEVDINTNTTTGGGSQGTQVGGGTITLHCRDMVKLLLDQDIYPPLIPTVKDPSGNYVWYPMQYQRFYFKEIDSPVVVYGRLSDPPKKYIKGMVQDGDGHGYWLIGDDGGVFAFGNNAFWGSLGGAHPQVFKENAIGIARAPVNPAVFVFGEQSQYPNLVWSGYWLADANGFVYGYGTGKDPAITTTYNPALFPATGSAGLNGLTTFTAHPDPVVAICAATSKDGYWLVTRSGVVYGYGAGVVNHGNATAPYIIVAMASTVTGNGYWLLDLAGQVYSFGDAAFYGNGPFPADPTHYYSGMCATPSGNGYYLTALDGGVFTFGDAVFRGSVPSTTSPYSFGGGTYTAGGPQIILDGSAGSFDEIPAYPAIVGFSVTGADLPAGTTVTHVNSSTDIVLSHNFTVTHDFDGSITIAAPLVLNDPVIAIDVSPDNAGYWLAAQDGGVFTYGNVQFYGSLPGAFDVQFPFDGNYADYADIIKDLALWAGFLLYSPVPALDSSFHPPVFGDIETTGVYCPQLLDDTIFDKAPVMDAMKKIKEVVGYIIWCDGDGGLHFESANTWAPGNFLFETGMHTPFIPVIDENVQLTNYNLQSNDTALRSQIIISTDEPYLNIPGVHTTTITPSTAALLKGLVKTAEWVNEYFTDDAQQKVMAELIALQIFFQSRVGTLNMVANPHICINDQVQIMERQSDEVYVHYVRQIASTFNFQSGQYMMTLTTHMLGLPDAWVVVPPVGMPTGAFDPSFPILPVGGARDRVFEVSPELHAFLQKSPAKATQHWPGSAPVPPPRDPQLLDPRERVLRTRHRLQEARRATGRTGSTDGRP